MPGHGPSLGGEGIVVMANTGLLRLRRPFSVSNLHGDFSDAARRVLA